MTRWRGGKKGGNLNFFHFTGLLQNLRCLGVNRLEGLVVGFLMELMATRSQPWAVQTTNQFLCQNSHCSSCNLSCQGNSIVVPGMAPHSWPKSFNIGRMQISPIAATSFHRLRNHVLGTCGFTWSLIGTCCGTNCTLSGLESTYTMRLMIASL